MHDLATGRVRGGQTPRGLCTVVYNSRGPAKTHRDAGQKPARRTALPELRLAAIPLAAPNPRSEFTS
jgi:hypothetical protein